MSSHLRVDGVSFLVCATQRSGSTLLCELLKGSEVAGVPDEFFEALRSTGLPRQPSSISRRPELKGSLSGCPRPNQGDQRAPVSSRDGSAMRFSAEPPGTGYSAQK